MTLPLPLMHGKKGLVMGIANDRSLAWGIAKAAHAQGAEIAATYQGEALAQAGPAAGRAAGLERWSCRPT